MLCHKEEKVWRITQLSPLHAGPPPPTDSARLLHTLLAKAALPDRLCTKKIAAFQITE
jgi:hypothetical protein